MGALSTREKKHFRDVTLMITSMSSMFGGIFLVIGGMMYPELGIGLVGDLEFGMALCVSVGIVCAIFGIVLMKLVEGQRDDESDEQYTIRLKAEKERSPSALLAMLSTLIMGLFTGGGVLCVLSLSFYQKSGVDEGIDFGRLYHDMSPNTEVQLISAMVVLGGFIIGVAISLAGDRGVDQKALVEVPKNLLARRTERKLHQHLRDQDEKEQAGKISMSAHQSMACGALNTPKD